MPAPLDGEATAGASSAMMGAGQGAFDATVIIAARDRRDELAQALDALEGERRPGVAFEMIVVDDGSTDGTAAMLAKRAREGGLVAIRNATSIGPGLARNAGAKRARGRVLVFLDSDCVVRPGWLAAMLAPLERPEVAAAGGAEELDPDEPLLARVFHFCLTSAVTTGRLRGLAGRKVGRYRPRTFSMAVRREVFERVGGFAPMRNGEDLDLSLRISDQGGELVFAEGARVRHRRGRSYRVFFRQTFAMGRARATLIRRDRRHAEPAFLLPGIVFLLALGGVAAVALSPAARAVAVWPLGGAAAWLAVVAVAAGIALRDLAGALLAPGAFVVQCLGYGAGLLYGVARPFPEERAP